MAKILIGIVTYGKHRFCLDELLESLKAQTMKADVLFVVNNGEDAYAKLIRSKGFEAVEDPTPAETRIDKVVNGRKFLRKHALDNNYDELIFLDSDVMLPPHGVEWLNATNGDVVSGIYLSAFELGNELVVAPVLFKDAGDGNAQLFTPEAVKVPKIMEIGAAGFGCTRIKRKVLEQIEIRTFGKNKTGGEDMAFYVDARAKGFKTYANTLVKCTHRAYPKDDPRSKVLEFHTNVESWPTFKTQ